MKKIAIITGASGGLGKEFVRLLLNDVDETWAVGRNISKLENLKEELESLEHKIVPLQMDLSKIESLELLFEKLKAEVKSYMPVKIARTEI